VCGGVYSLRGGGALGGSVVRGPTRDRWARGTAAEAWASLIEPLPQVGLVIVGTTPVPVLGAASVEGVTRPGGLRGGGDRCVPVTAWRLWSGLVALEGRLCPPVGDPRRAHPGRRVGLLRGGAASPGGGGRGFAVCRCFRGCGRSADLARGLCGGLCAGGGVGPGGGGALVVGVWGGQGWACLRAWPLGGVPVGWGWPALWWVRALWGLGLGSCGWSLGGGSGGGGSDFGVLGLGSGGFGGGGSPSGGGPSGLGLGVSLCPRLVVCVAGVLAVGGGGVGGSRVWLRMRVGGWVGVRWCRGGGVVGVGGALPVSPFHLKIDYAVQGLVFVREG